MRRVVVAWCFALAGFTVAMPPSRAAAGGGGCHRLTEGTGVTVEATSACFAPGVLRVEPGTEVTWVNRDPIAHVVVGTGWALPDLAPGASGAFRFSADGTYPYSCHLHPGMNGVVVVGTGAGGSPPEAVPVDAAPVSLGAAPASTAAAGSSGAVGAGAAGAAAGAVAGLAAGRMWRRSRRRA